MSTKSQGGAGAYSPSKSPPTGISGGLTPGTVLVQGTESGELHFPSFPLVLKASFSLSLLRIGSSLEEMRPRYSTLR